MLRTFRKYFGVVIVLLYCTCNFFIKALPLAFKYKFCECQPKTLCLVSNQSKLPRQENTKLHVLEENILPNLFGIDPIEASIIFGVLYYIFGPTALYGLAKDAGRLFSTYYPIAKEVSTNIYEEFKEYFEEDKERDLLRKQGFNIDRLPRRTSTIIQRFTETYEVFVTFMILTQIDSLNIDMKNRV